MKKIVKSFISISVVAFVALFLLQIKEVKATEVLCPSCSTTSYWCEKYQQWFTFCDYNGNGCDVSKQQICNQGGPN
jgi:invasion protein IalB